MARTNLLLLFLPAGNDKKIGVFFGAAGFPAAGDFAPQSFRPAQAAALPSLAAALGMIHRIHRRPADGRPNAEPARPAGFAQTP